MGRLEICEILEGEEGMKKVVLFAFNGDKMCFIHVLLNALDMKEKGYEVKIVVEGSATKLVPEMAKEGDFLNPLYEKAKAAGLFTVVCKACSAKMKVLEAVEKAGLPLGGTLKGHPSMSEYLDQGYQLVTF